MNAAGVDGTSNGAVPAASPAPEARAPHRQCIGCGYDVVGLPLNGPCTECGRPVRETVDRFMLRSEPTAAASIRRARIGFYGMLGVLVSLVTLIVLAIFSASSQTPTIDRLIQQIGPETLVLTISTCATLAAAMITSGLCMTRTTRRLRPVALGLTPLILAFPWIVNLTTPRVTSEHIAVACFSMMMVAIGTLAAIFVRAVRSTALSCDDFKFLTLARRWSWVIIAWIALAAAPIAALIWLMFLTRDEADMNIMIWLSRVIQFYFVLVALPLSLIALLTALLLTFRTLRVAKVELAASQGDAA